MNEKASAKDLIVLIEFVCVEAGRRAGEPRGSWHGKQNTLYYELDYVFCFFLPVSISLGHELKC